MHPFAMTYAWTQRRGQDLPLPSGPRRRRGRGLLLAMVRSVVRQAHDVGRRAHAPAAPMPADLPDTAPAGSPTG